MSKLKVIYEPKGKAREYAELAINLFNGCRNECEYCYAPSIMHTNAENFHSKIEPRKNIINKIEHDAAILSGDSREIFLCFTCDPYSYGSEFYTTTTEALEILLDYGLNINILSKGGNRTLRDFDLLVSHKNQVRIGASLVFIDDAYSFNYETFAAPTSERCEVLHKYYKFGIKTWASLEPIWSADNTCKIIELTHSYIDTYKIGKLNYHPHAAEIDWYKTIPKIVETCKSNKVDYTIKNETVKYITKD